MEKVQQPVALLGRLRVLPQPVAKMRTLLGVVQDLCVLPLHAELQQDRDVLHYAKQSHRIRWDWSRSSCSRLHPLQIRHDRVDLRPQFRLSRHNPRDLRVQRRDIQRLTVVPLLAIRRHRDAIPLHRSLQIVRDPPDRLVQLAPLRFLRRRRHSLSFRFVHGFIECRCQVTQPCSGNNRWSPGHDAHPPMGRL